jgi:hypothetical protein
VDYRTDSGTWWQHANLNCDTSMREEWTKQQPLNNRRRKNKLPNYLARLWHSFGLNTNTRTECWRSNTRT